LPAGSTSEGEIVLRPVIVKSLLKGTIAVSVFSLFLEITPATLSRYAEFLVLYYAFLAFYVVLKHSHVYTIGGDGITMKRTLRATKHLPYSEIGGVSVAQGILARRFRCGTVFLDLKGGGGSVRSVGGGSAEALRDVKEPGRVADEIVARLSLF
jgi:membrane protein YdbS with pleckstrin-like domain